MSDARTANAAPTGCESAPGGGGRAGVWRAGLLLPALALLGACAVPAESNIDPDTGYFLQVPEQIAAIAAPGQDLSAVQLRDDGCYWYRYAGPVETTMLPLRAVGGQPICQASGEEAPPPAVG